ncbi:MAG: hypothetical protein ACTS8R_02945 [Arsenophonus sp. NC-QC1-MAG3]
MSKTDVAKLPYNPFDFSKVWQHKYFLLIDIDKFKFNRNS